MTDQGLIFNIQKFSVHDGPGIRTTVFFKGCPLQCPWCSNPESKSFLPELMVRNQNCRSCGACVMACPRAAITVTPRAGRIIDRAKCNQCLCCVANCLYGSLNRCGTSMDVGEVLHEVLQDKLFYKNSGGGVTLSGGEPLSQASFARRLLEASRREGLHTALETTGAVAWDDLEGVLRFVDLLLFDIKHLDSHEHRKTTGVHNDRILANLRKAARHCPVWLRVPLIAGFNDSESHIKDIASLGSEIGAEKISLLPYHEGGKAKSEQLGVPYGFARGKAPDENRIQTLKKIIETAGVPVAVGS